MVRRIPPFPAIPKSLKRSVFLFLIALPLLLSCKKEQILNQDQPRTGLIVTAFGASVVEGSGGNNFEVPLQAKLANSLKTTVTVHNKGIGGNTTKMGLGRIRAVLQETKPEYIIITLGFNDVNWDWNLPKTQANMDSIILISLNHKAKPILSSLTGLDTLKFSSQIKQRMEAINQVYHQIAHKYNIPFLDLYTPLTGHPDLFTMDGLHPNAAGYQVISEKWHQAILKELKK